MSIFPIFQNSCLFYCPVSTNSGMKMDMSTADFPETACYKKAQGFTLFEVIFVLAIIAVLTTVILARNNPSAARTRLYGQADLLKSQLRYAQARSMNSNQIWGLRAQAQSVWLFTGGNTANRMYLPGENDRTIVYNANDLSGITVDAFLLSFDERGRPCSDAAGTILRTAPLSITLNDANSGASANIAITQNTGFIQ